MELLDAVAFALGKSAPFKPHIPLGLMRMLIPVLQRVPQFPITMDQIIAHLVKRRSSNNAFSIVVVAEGINLETIGGHEEAGVSTEQHGPAPA